MLLSNDSLLVQSTTDKIRIDSDLLADSMTFSISEGIVAALIGAIVTILTTVVYDRLKEGERKDDNLKFFAVLLKSFISHSNSISLKIRRYSEDINNDIFTFPLYHKLPSDIFERTLKKVNEESFFYAFREHYKIFPEMLGVLNSIQNDIFFQSEIYNNYLTELEKYRSIYSVKANEYQSDFNELIKLLRQEFIPKRTGSAFHEDVFNIFEAYVAQILDLETMIIPLKTGQ